MSKLLGILALLLLVSCRKDEDGIPQHRDPASYAVSSSLSSSHVTAFGEDASGQIWIGTNGGLNRYTGKEFY